MYTYFILRRTDIKGQILTNGHPRNMQLFKKLSSYIMQEDLLQPRLTVQESLSYAARLKIGNELSTEDRNKAVSIEKNSNIIYTIIIYDFIYLIFCNHLRFML